jgi:hypothetical protein
MIRLLFLILLVVGLSALLGGVGTIIFPLDGTTIFLLLVAATAVTVIIMLRQGRRSVLG